MTRQAGSVTAVPPDPDLPPLTRPPLPPLAPPPQGTPPPLAPPGDLPSPIQDHLVGGPRHKPAGERVGPLRGRWRAWRQRRKERWAAGAARRERCSNGCDVACCTIAGCDFCADGPFLTSILAICWVALRTRPADPHTAAPHHPAARAAWRWVRAYQLTVSAHRPRPVCPMSPSCSRYALQALSAHGLMRGGALTVRRLRRCSPRAVRDDPVPAPISGPARP